MSAPNRSVVRKFYENDDFSYEYRDNSSPTGRNVNSASDVNLIRTRNLDRDDTPVKSSPTKLTPMKGLLMTGGILLTLTVVIVASAALGVVLTRNPTVIANTTTTTVATTERVIYWSFDTDVTDANGVYNGTLLNGATLSSNTYFGIGSALAGNNSLNQSAIVSSPFLNLSYTSFTVEAWIFGFSLTGDNAIFGQCQCTTCRDQCLYLIIRNYKMYMGFMLDDVVGLTSLSANTWYHVAYVYDYSTLTQSLYLQGVLDNSKSSAGPYQGRNGSILLGSSHLSGSTFNGLIDNLRVTTRAKSAAELLTAATLIAYFPFDNVTLIDDNGPNKIYSTISNAAVVTGRVNQAVSFNGVSSYMQAYGFYSLGRSSQAHSYALWIYPYSIAGGTIIHKRITQFSGSPCADVMGLTNNGQISFRTYGSSAQITGPFIPALQWTHIAYTYSTTAGQSMYINGVLFLSTGAVSYSGSGAIDWLTIGYNLGSCTYWPINGGYYIGAVDELYVFRRELTADEVYSLANP